MQTHYLLSHQVLHMQNHVKYDNFAAPYVTYTHFNPFSIAVKDNKILISI